MTLIKTSLLNAIAVSVKMLTLLGINKILAVYVGPAGYAALGQFQNAMQMITTLASGAINTGVTKYTAEYYDDEVRQRLVWRTAGTIALFGSITTALFISLFNQQLAIWLLKDVDYGSVFIWFAAALVLVTLNTLLLAILNGKKSVTRYVAANIAGSLFGLIVTVIMAMNFGLYGALVALAIYQSLSFFVTLFLCFKTGWFKLNYIYGAIDKATAFDLSKYAAMAFTSAACVPISHMLLRDYVGDTLGWEAAGYWEAMWRLSAAYLMLVTTTLSVYYLPRLSELKDAAEIKHEIINGYRLILPVAAVGGIVIYLLRDFIVGVLFTEEFEPMRDLFAWQMVGDTLKIGSWILAYLMLSKAMVKLFIFTEIIFSVSFVLLSYSLIGALGLVGIAVAYTINYGAYWMLLSVLIFSRLRDNICCNDD